MLLFYGAGEAFAVQATGDSGAPAISASGRCVAFESTAPELVAGDTNAKKDVFVRDAKDRLTERVSVSSSGVQANGDSFDASISDDGRYVSFTSLASNLVIGDTNGVEDVFLFDRVTRAVERVSVSGSGGQLAFGGNDAALAGGGRYIAFVSKSPATPISCNAADNGVEDVYVYDSSVKHAAYEVSTWDFNDFAGFCDGPAEGDGPSMNPTISADGGTVAFESDATDLEWNGGVVPPGGRLSNDTNGVRDVYVRSPGAGPRRHHWLRRAPRRTERVETPRYRTTAPG